MAEFDRRHRGLAQVHGFADVGLPQVEPGIPAQAAQLGAPSLPAGGSLNLALSRRVSLRGVSDS